MGKVAVGTSRYWVGFCDNEPEVFESVVMARKGGGWLLMRDVATGREWNGYELDTSPTKASALRLAFKLCCYRVAGDPMFKRRPDTSRELVARIRALATMIANTPDTPTKEDEE